MVLKELFQQLKHNKQGVAVLAVGLIAVLAVSILAIQKFSTNINVSNDTKKSFQEIQAQEFIQKEPPKPKRVFARQKSISESDIEGSWNARLEEARALLQMRGRTYKLIVVNDNPVEARFYSNGTYILKNDLLVLTPNLEWGPPKSRRYRYNVLMRSNLPVIVSKHKGKLVWQLPGPEADIYVPNFHQILSRTEDDIAVWDVLK